MSSNCPQFSFLNINDKSFANTAAGNFAEKEGLPIFYILFCGIYP